MGVLRRACLWGVACGLQSPRKGKSSHGAVTLPTLPRVRMLVSESFRVPRQKSAWQGADFFLRQADAAQADEPRHTAGGQRSVGSADRVSKWPGGWVASPTAQRHHPPVRRPSLPTTDDLFHCPIGAVASASNKELQGSGRHIFYRKNPFLVLWKCLRESSAAPSEHGTAESDLAHRKMMVDETFKEAVKVALGQLLI